MNGRYLATTLLELKLKINGDFLTIPTDKKRLSVHLLSASCYQMVINGSFRISYTSVVEYQQSTTGVYNKAN